MDMEIPANKARMEFALEGTPYPIIAVQGEERLNQGFFFQLDIQIALHQYGDEFVGRRAELRFTGLDGDRRSLVALIESAEEVGFDPGGAKRIALGLMPRFRILERITGPALWLGLDFPGLVKTLTDETGQPHAGSLVFDFAQPHGPRPWTLRAPGESSAELIQRRMAHEGIFFRVDEDAGASRLIFADHNAHCPYVSGGAVRTLAEAGMTDSESGRPQTGVFRIAHHSVAQSGAARGYVLPETTPTRPLASDPRASQRPGLESRFETQCTELPGAEAWAQLRDRYNDQQAEYLTMLANRVDLAAGHCITLEAGPAPGDYLIIAVKHRNAQAAGLNVAGPTVAYTCEATLIPRARPYVSAFPPKRVLPALIGARIESNSTYAELDELGRYRLRQLFEPGVNPHARASVPIRKQSPHGGPRSDRGKPVGWHAPLQDGVEVLLSCLNNDPEQLTIAGGLYNPGNRSPVLAENLTQNIYRSVSGNALIMDDKKSKELIKLHARDGLLCLELNADKTSQWVGLSTIEGAAELSAKKTQHLKSGDTLTERTQSDRIQQVENRHLTKTNKGEIHQQSARDAAIKAGEFIEIVSGGDTRFIAGRHFRLNVEGNANFTIEQGDALVHVKEGEVHFQGTKSMRIRGQGGGPITFEQGGAGFRIQPNGDIDLFGKTVSLGGPNGVNFHGEVNYEVPGSAKAPSPSVCGPIECPPVAALSDDYVPGVRTPPTFFEILYSPNTHEIILLDEQGVKQLELYEQRLDQAAGQLEAARTQSGADKGAMLVAQKAVRKELRTLSENSRPDKQELAPLVEGKVEFQEMIRIGKAKYSLVPEKFLQAFRERPRHYYTLPRDIIGSIREVARRDPDQARDAQRGWRYTAADEALNANHKKGHINREKVKKVFGQVKAEIKQDWELTGVSKSGQIPSALVARGLFPNLSKFLSDDDFELIDQWIAQLNEDANVSTHCYEKYRREAMKALDKNTDKDEKDPDNYFQPEDWDLARRMVGDIWGEKSELYLDMMDTKYDKASIEHIRVVYRNKIARTPLPPTAWDASAGAQVMRYAMGATLKGEFDLLKKGRLAISGEAKLDAALAEAKAEGGFYLPHSNGWKLRPKVPVRSDHIEYKPFGKSANQDQSENRGFVQLGKSEHLPYFAVDSSLITPSGATSIFHALHHWSVFKQAANRYQNDATRRDLMVQVVGHTSATGSEGYNQALGMRRATIVAEFIRQSRHFELWMSQFAQGHWGQDEADFMAYAILVFNGTIKTEVDWDDIVTANHKVSLVAQLKRQVPDLERQAEAASPEMRAAIFLPSQRWSEIKTDSGRLQPVTRLAYLIEWYVDRVKYHAYGKAGLQEDLFKKIPFYSEPYISRGETELAKKVDSEAFQNRRCDFMAWEIDTEKSHKVYTQTEVNFGEFRIQLRGHISGWAGANIHLGGELALASPKGMMAAVGAIRDVKNQGKVGEQTIKGAKEALSAGSNAAAFAGAKAELGLKGSADWKRPPQEPKYGEPLHPSDFQSLGSIGYTVTGMVGLGGKFDLKIGFDQTSQRFVMRMAAEACLGPGFGGQLDITVGIGQCWDFITLVHGQLKRHDFSYMDFFEKENDESGIDVFELFSAWQRKMFYMSGLPVVGPAMAVGSSAGMIHKLLVDFRELLVDWENSKVIQTQTDNLIETLHEKPELLRYLTPEAKGRMLYDLLSVPIDWSERLSNWSSLDINKRREESALILIQEGVVSWADWRETLEHMGEIQNSKLTPRVTPNATREHKAQRVRNNLAWLQSELLNDEEDWNALQSHLRNLPAQQ